MYPVNLWIKLGVILYTCWTEPTLTFNLLCRSILMLGEAKLSPTSVSICTTNQMSLQQMFYYAESVE